MNDYKELMIFGATEDCFATLTRSDIPHHGINQIQHHHASNSDRHPLGLSPCVWSLSALQSFKGESLSGFHLWHTYTEVFAEADYPNRGTLFALLPLLLLPNQITRRCSTSGNGDRIRNSPTRLAIFHHLLMRFSALRHHYSLYNPHGSISRTMLT